MPMQYMPPELPTWERIIRSVSWSVDDFAFVSARSGRTLDRIELLWEEAALGLYESTWDLVEAE